jgi:hypothetical protein
MKSTQTALGNPRRVHGPAIFAEVCKRCWAVHGMPIGCSSSASVRAEEASINCLLSIPNHGYVYYSCNKLSRSCTATCSSSHERCQMPWKPLGGAQRLFMNSVGMLCGQASGLQTDYAWILERLPPKCRWTRNPVYCSILSKRLMTMDMLVKEWRSFPTFNA